MDIIELKQLIKNYEVLTNLVDKQANIKAYVDYYDKIPSEYKRFGDIKYLEFVDKLIRVVLEPFYIYDNDFECYLTYEEILDDNLLNNLISARNKQLNADEENHETELDMYLRLKNKLGF